MTLSISLASLRKRGSKIGSLVRLHPFDVTTEEGRSQERYRRAFLSMLGSMGVKGLSLLSALISVPLTIAYLGKERYGLWLTISSVLVALSFADLGMGAGLLNAISEAHGKNDRAIAHKYVSSAFFILSGISATILLVFTAIFHVVPWPHLLGVTSPFAAKEAGPAIAVLITAFALNIPLDTVQRVQVGYQEGFSSNLWQAGGSLASLLTLLWVIHERGGLPWLVFSMTGIPLLFVALNWVTQFTIYRPWLRPNWKMVDGTACRKIFNNGMMFVSVNVGASALTAAPILLTARSFGAAEAGIVGVVLRLFLMPYTICEFSWASLWPAYGEAYARQDYSWIRATVKRSVTFAVGLITVIAVPLALACPAIVYHWTHRVIQAYQVGYSLAFSAALLILVRVLRGVFSMPVNGCGRLRRQAFTFPIAAALAWLFLFVPHRGLSPAWVPLWVALCEMLVAVFLIIDTRGILRETKKTP